MISTFPAVRTYNLTCMFRFTLLTAMVNLSHLSLFHTSNANGSFLVFKTSFTSITAKAHPHVYLQFHITMVYLSCNVQFHIRNCDVPSLMFPFCFTLLTAIVRLSCLHTFLPAVLCLPCLYAGLYS